MTVNNPISLIFWFRPDSGSEMLALSVVNMGGLIEAFSLGKPTLINCESNTSMVIKFLTK